MPGLGAGDVEADDAGIPVAVGEFGDLQGARRMPHRGEQGADPDPVPILPGEPLALPEPLVDRLDDLFQGQPPLQVLLGRVPHLGVDHPVLGEVSAHSRATRTRLSRVCITPTVCRKVSR